MAHPNPSAGPLGYPGGAAQSSQGLATSQNYLTNDSFQMSSTPILASTRPYDTTSSAAVEKFLTTGLPNTGARTVPPVLTSTSSSKTKQVSVPGAGGTTASPPLQTSAHSNFAVPASWQQQSVPQGTSVSSTSPSLASTLQPHQTGITSPTSPRLFVDPHALGPLSSSSGMGGGGSRSRMQQQLGSSGAPISTTGAPIITSVQRHTGRSPTSQEPGAGFPMSQPHSSSVHNSAFGSNTPSQQQQRMGSVNGQTRASDESLRRSPYGSPHPQLSRVRSDRELTSLFSSGQNGAGRVSPVTGNANGGAAGGRVSPSMMHGSSHHSGGSRQSNSTTASRPQWLNAVERLRQADTRQEPVLPLDQSKLGMQAHRAQQQGVLTAAQLRSHEEQAARSSNTGFAGRYSTGPRSVQPLFATSGSPGGRRSPSGHSGSQIAPLRAQEVMLQGSDSRSNALGSEGSTWRRGHVRSTAPVSSRGAVSAGGRVSPFKNHGTPVNAGNLNPSYSTMNSDPFMGVYAKRDQAAMQQPHNFFTGMAHKGAGALPALFASEVHEAEASSPTDKAPGKGDKKGKDGSPSSPRKGKATTGGGGDGGDGSSNGGDDGNGSGGAPSNKGKGRKGHSHLEEDERDEQMLRSRDYNALHAIPWEQRRTMPMTGFGTRIFAMLSSPRIWEKLDWTLRGAVLTILPTMVLSLEPATAPKFPMASNLAFTAFWITMPTFGAGIRELFIAIKGFCMGLVFVLITVAINPPDWGVILCLFFFTLICAFVAEQSRKTIAYVLSSSLMQLISDREGTDYKYVGIYYEAIFVALAFGFAAFLVPFIRWSSRVAKHYIKALGNALSIEVQGMASSFWVRNPLERELNVVRLRQLRHTAEECMKKISVAIGETGYEPHSGKFVSMLKGRFKFCQSIHNILGSLTQVVELLCDNPELTDTPMCNTFGVQIADDLAVIASAMDTIILKIVDFSRIVAVEEIFFFQQARERFQEALSKVREDVILNNEDYETDESDVFLGFFMFSIDELCETIASYQEDPAPRNNIVYWLTFWIRDIKSSIAAFRSLCLTFYYNRTITRRLKEAIKLSLCMALPVIFQVYALKNQPTSPMAGASVIAFMYNPTGSESFHYCSGRLLGTVLGSTASLLSVQIANGRRGVLYVFIALLSIIACYVQAAPGFYSLGNAMACSTISITTQYKDQSAAMLRIQQNCFAILIYFFIISVIWPMRGRTKVKMGLDVSLRCLRESTARLLCNLDMPYDAEEVVTDVSALLLEMDKKIAVQDRFIPGAVEEPTLSSAEFPADAWKRIVEAETSIHSTLAMMRFAYREFMSSRADPNTELSVHWVVLHRIAPHAKDLSDLVYATIDLHLLSLSKTTEVPASQLTRLRRGMIEAQKEILQTYIQTISHKIAGQSDDDGENGDEEDDEYYDDEGSYNSSLPAPPPDDDGNNNNNSDDGGSSAAGSSNGPDARKGKKSKPDNSNANGSDKDNDDDDDDGSHHTDGSPEHQKKKKKTGYLGYKLTAEEAQALKDFINNGRVPAVTNASFSATTGVKNASFSPASFGTAVSAASAANNNSNLSGTRTLNNMSMTRVPAALLEAMAENPSWKTGALAQHGNNDGRMMALAGNDDGLAARLRKKHHLNKKDEDDTKGAKDDKAGQEDEEMTLTNNRSFGNNRSFDKNASFFLKNASFLGKMFRRRKTDYQDDLDGHNDDDDDNERTGSPAERQLTEAMSHASSQHSSPSRVRGKGGLSVSSNSVRDPFSPASARSRSHHDPETDEDDPLGRAIRGTGDPTNPLMSSSKTSASPSANASGTEMPEVFNDSELKMGDAPASPLGPPAAATATANTETISTAHASADLQRTTTAEIADAADVDVEVKKTETDPNPANDADDTHAVKSSNSSGGTGSTEKKVVSANDRSSSDTHKSSPDRDLIKEKATGKLGDAAGTGGSSLFAGQLVQSMGGDDGSQDPPNGALGNISFFDPDSGEFILTNHDIHSLEAFLFGTRALVVYLNDLQKSILEMQHSSELAKKL